MKFFIYIIIILFNLVFVILSEIYLSKIDINLPTKLIVYYVILVFNICLSIFLILKNKLKYKYNFIMLIFIIYLIPNINIIKEVIHNDFIGDIDNEREKLSRGITKFIINILENKNESGPVNDYQIILNFDYKENKTIFKIIYFNYKNNKKYIFTSNLKYLKKKHILKILNKYNPENMNSSEIYVNINELDRL